MRQVSVWSLTRSWLNLKLQIDVLSTENRDGRSVAERKSSARIALIKIIMKQLLINPHLAPLYCNLIVILDIKGI